MASQEEQRVSRRISFDVYVEDIVRGFVGDASGFEQSSFSWREEAVEIRVCLWRERRKGENIVETLYFSWFMADNNGF